MKLRPVDTSGDILPVSSAGGMVYGPQAVALLVEDRLNLLTGEWWENRGSVSLCWSGCGIPG